MAYWLAFALRPSLYGAVNQILTIADLKHKLSSARKDARIWKERYEVLMAQVKDFLAAIKKAPERVIAFIDRILDTEKAEPEQPKKQRETTLVK